MDIDDKYIYEDDEGNKVYEFCESCHKPVLQEDVGDGVYGCEHCKNPNQITINVLENNSLNIVDYDELPENVKDILQSKDEDEDGYKEMSRIEDELKTVGWYMDWFLDEEITELRPMTEQEIKEHEQDKAEYEERTTPHY